MIRKSVYLLLISLFAMTAVAQEEAEPASAEDAEPAPNVSLEAPLDEAPTASEEDEEAPDEELDDSDLDLQTYEEDEDDFVPTEEIPADQAIPFPADI